MDPWTRLGVAKEGSCGPDPDLVIRGLVGPWTRGPVDPCLLNKGLELHFHFGAEDFSQWESARIQTEKVLLWDLFFGWRFLLKSADF